MDFQYAINPYSTLPIILLNKHIGMDDEEGMGIDGKVFAKELFEIDSCLPSLITIYVNSLGGDVEHGFDIMNAIDACKTYVKVVIAGFAYSTMGWAILPADEIEVKGYGQWMCHMPKRSAGDAGSPFLDMVSKSITNILSNKSGRGGREKKTEAEVLQMMYNKTFFSGQQMYEHGFADRVVNTGLEERSREYDYKEYQNILNKEVEETKPNTNISKQKDMSFPKVANRLKISEDSSEQEYLGAIAVIENRASNFEREAADNKQKLEGEVAKNSELNGKLAAVNTQLTEKQELLSAKESELAAKNSELATARQELEKANELVLAAQNKEKEAQDAAKLEKATNLIEKHKTKLKAGTDAHFLEMAVENYERTEAILENLQVSAELPKASNMINKGEGTPVKDETSFQKAKNVVKERIKAERTGQKQDAAAQA